MWPDRVSNPGPLTYESGVLPTALCGRLPFEPFVCRRYEQRNTDEDTRRYEQRNIDWAIKIPYSLQ